MLENKGEFARKNAGRIVGIALVLLLVLLALVKAFGGGEKNADSTEKRLAFLQELGWDCGAESERRAQVKIPDCSSGAMKEYNKLMLRGGYDLSAYSGKTLEQYRYEIENYPDCNQTVYVILYVSGGRVVGGDIHTEALNGFMHELRARETE